MKTLWKETLKTWLFGLEKIKMIFWLKPRIIELTKERCEVKIPLNWKTRNHVRSMYVGVLAAGADIAGGMFIMKTMEAMGAKVGFIFKDFHADFLKLALADTHFICTEGKEVRKAVEETIRTKQRVNKTIHIYATTPKLTGDEPVAKFLLTISVKAK